MTIIVAQKNTSRRKGEKNLQRKAWEGSKHKTNREKTIVYSEKVAAQGENKSMDIVSNKYGHVCLKKTVSNQTDSRRKK